MNTGPVLVDVAVKDLSGAALDWAVGVIEGATPMVDGRLEWVVGSLSAVYNPGLPNNPLNLQNRGYGWCPSTEWRQGGPLIHKYRILFDESGTQLCAWGAGIDDAYGPDHLTAACRAIVAAKLGDIVKVPACLVMP